MIIDSNLVLIDHLTKDEIGDAGQNMSRAVPLTSFLEPGRQGPMKMNHQHQPWLFLNHHSLFFSGYDPPAVTFSSLLVMHSHSNTGRLWMAGTF